MIKPTRDWSKAALQSIGYLLVGVAVASTLTSVVLSLSLGRPDNAIQQTLILVPFALVLIGLLRAVPRNRTVWVLAWAAALGGSSDTASTMVLARTGFTVDEFTNGSVPGSPADLDLITGVAVNFAAWSWLAIFLLSVHLLLLFPTGEPSSRRWGILVRVATGALVMGSLATALALAPWVGTPFAEIYSGGDVLWTAGSASLLLLIATVPSIVNLVLRYRRSVGEERLQYRWVAWALGVNGVVLLSFGWLAGFEVYGYLSAASLAAIPLSIGIAISKYRLYEIDSVISRTLVYGALAAFIGAVYVGIVVGLGQLFDTGDDSTLWLGIGATVVIALAFQPLRRRLQRLANRLVFGRRATPYEVLSSFSQSVAAVDPRVLEDVARSLADGTTATAASIWVRTGGDLHPIASWPSSPESAEDMTAGHHVEEVVHDGERLGLVKLTLPPGQPIPPNDVNLVEQITAGLGLALRNLQLTDDLQSRVEQLRESRRRVVAIQDQTRQMLERDLHDGAQQRLVALKIKVGLSAAMAEKQGLEDVKSILDTVKEETDLTIESLRNLARGIYPPLLEAEGLGAALTAQLRRAPLPVTVQAAGIGRHPRELEATVYFCVLEAVQNAIKHARANSVLVALSEEEAELRFEVRDDGLGFDREAPTDGQGLQNLEDRLDAVNGTLEVATSRDHGTTVIGRVRLLLEVSS